MAESLWSNIYDPFDKYYCNIARLYHRISQSPSSRFPISKSPHPPINPSAHQQIGTSAHQPIGTSAHHHSPQKYNQLKSNNLQPSIFFFPRHSCNFRKCLYLCVPLLKKHSLKSSLKINWFSSENLVERCLKRLLSYWFSEAATTDKLICVDASWIMFFDILKRKYN